MSLVAWLPLLYGDLNDKCGRKVDTTFGASAPTSASAGKIGQGYLFSSHGIRIKNIPVTKTMSFALWIKLTSDSACHILDLRGHDNGTETGYQPIYYDGSGIQIYSSAGANSAYNSCHLGTNWHHLVVTIEDGHGRLYLDGVYQNENTSLVGCVDTCHLTLGCRCNGNNKMPGIIQDVRIYNHVLSMKEIKELGRALVLHYDFNTPLFETSTNVTNDPALWAPYTEYWHVVTYTPTGVKLVRPAGSIMPCLALSHSSFAGATQVGTTWTFSCFLYKNGRPWKATCPSCESSYGYSNITWESHDNGYYRCTFTHSFAHSHSSWVIHNYLFGDAAIGEECEMRYMQLEKSDHATPYTNSTRTGMVIDSSGLGNDGLLINPSYYRFMTDSACGSGSLHSAGNSGAYIKTVFVPNFIQGTGTICLWYKKDANAFNYNSGNFLIATQHSAGYYFGATNSTSVWHSGASHGEFYIDGTKCSGGGITDTNWHFYVFTGVDLSQWNTFALHCHGDDQWLYRGQIGDFRIYNTNLTQDDINELYHTSWQSNPVGASFIRSVTEGSGTVKLPKNGDINCKELYETGILPAEYEALDGLYFNRGPCINTGVVINDATKLIRVAVDITAEHVSGNSCVLGCGNTLWQGPVMLNCCRNYLEAGVNGYDHDDAVPQGVFEDGERFVYHADIQPNHQIFYKNGAPIQNIDSRTLITSTYPVYIGGFNAPGGLTVNDEFLGWVHYVEIEYDTIKRRMVPCRRRSDEVLGMYDMVSGQFYAAATAGEWTRGSSTVSQSRNGDLCVGEIYEC